MSDKTPTDEQLAQWLYDAEYDWNAEYFDLEVEMPPMPSDTFPHYYSDDYHPTLAVIFRELIESRARLAAIPKPDPDVVALAEGGCNKGASGPPAWSDDNRRQAEALRHEAMTGTRTCPTCNIP